jgi:hypothetical protein
MSEDLGGGSAGVSPWLVRSLWGGFQEVGLVEALG